MDSIRWKSFSQTGFKSLEPSNEEVPMPDESEINQTTESEVMQEIIDTAFGDDCSSTPPPPPNGFDLSITSNSATPGYYIDPTTGKLVKDESKIPFPAPTIQDIEEMQLKAKLDLKISDWDRITEMYKMKKDEYSQDMEMILEIIKKGAIPVDQLIIYKQLVELAEKAINTVNKALIEIPIKIEELKVIYKNEMAAFQKAMKTGTNITDYNTEPWEKRSKIAEAVSQLALQNLDDWIGEPGVGLRVVKNTTKGTVLFYGETQKYLALVSSDGTPVSDTWFDPSKEWTASNAGLILSDEKISVSEDGSTSDQTEDVTFLIDGVDQQEDYNKFGAKIDLGIPELMIVERDSDGNIKEQDIDSKDHETRLVPKKFAAIYDEESGKTTIMQTMAIDPANSNKIADMSKYAQVRIAYAKIFTDTDHPLDTKDGKKGFSHIVQLYTADHRIAMEMRIVNSLGADTQASDYQFAIHSDRELPVEIDASGLVQTCEGKMSETAFEEIVDEYDIEGYNPAGDGIDITKNKLTSGLSEEKKTAASDSFKFNFGRFVGSSYEQHLTAEDKVGGSGFGTEARRTTGLFSYGIIGTIRGAGNDFIAYGDPSETQSWRAREGKDEKDNPFYSNIFFGSAGAAHEVVLATNGDLYGTNLTALWRNNTKPRGITGVTMKTTFGNKLKTGAEANKDFLLNYEPDNVQNFLYVVGGEEIQVKNPSDTNLNGSGTYAADKSPDPEETSPKTHVGDDFYFTNGKGKFSCPNSGAQKNDGMDLDVDGMEQASIDNAAIEEVATDLFNALTDFEENMIDPELLPDINELGLDYYSSVESANGGFFTAISQMLGFEKPQFDEYAAENPQEEDTVGVEGVDAEFNK